MMLFKKTPPKAPMVDMKSFEDYYGQLYATSEYSEPLVNDETLTEASTEWYNGTNEKFEASARRMKRRKAVGPDGIAKTTTP